MNGPEPILVPEQVPEQVSEQVRQPVRQPVSDRLLLRRYASDRDLDAFHLLVQRHQGDLLRLAHGLLGEATAAEDAVQEAFLRLIREVETILAKAAGDSLGGWLCTVCRNHCLDLLRRRQVVRFFSLGTHDPEPPPVGDGVDAAPVWRAVRGLPAMERAAVLLRYRDGLAYADIAERLGKSVTHVGLLLHQAIGRLRQCPSLREGV